MHFFKDFCPFHFHFSNMHTALFPPTSSHKPQFLFLHLLSPMKSSYGVLWNPDPKKNKGMKLSEEKISCRRWTTGSTSKTPLAVPSLQAQHPSPTSGKVVHFQGRAFSPPQTLHYCIRPLKMARSSFIRRTRNIFSSLTSPIHYARVYSSSRAHYERV